MPIVVSLVDSFGGRLVVSKSVEKIGEYIADIIPENTPDFSEIGTYKIADCPDLVERISLAVLADLADKKTKIQRIAPSQSHLIPPLFLSPQDFITPPKDDQENTPFRRKSLLDTKGANTAYLAYLAKNFPDLSSFFFTRLKFRLPESARKKHTYILGGSGSGKSELMKVLMYPYISKKDRKETVILFDPHGDIAEQVGRWKEHINGDNIIYFDPTLKAGFTPCINPLDIPSNTSPQQLNYMAECLTEVFKEIVGGDSSITANMGTLLKAVLTILLQKEGSTLQDLQIFMRDDENAELLAYAIEHSPTGQRHFFENAFSDKTYKPTKNALYTKIQDLLNSQIFYDITIGKSTLNIRELMDSKKTVIFNLSKGKLGEQSSSAFGRFLLGMMQGFSFQRQDTPEKLRVPTHLFLDEFHNFVTPSIQTVLDESRKYGLHLTLVQQFFGQKTSTEIRASIMNNTAIKICGTGESTSLEAMAKVMIGATKEDLQNCERGEFFIKVKKQGGILQQAFGTHYARPFRNNISLLGFRNTMKPEEWKTLKAYQIEKYYRSLSGKSEAVEIIDGANPEEFTKPTPQNEAPENLALFAGLKKKALDTVMKNAKKKRVEEEQKNLEPETEKQATQKPSERETDILEHQVPAFLKKPVERSTERKTENTPTFTKDQEQKFNQEKNKRPGKEEKAEIPPKNRDKYLSKKTNKKAIKPKFTL